MNKCWLVIMTFLTALTGCSPISVDDYQDYSPALVASEFFEGKLTAHGVVKNRSGKVIRYFNADINAYWQDGVGTLEEDFVFNDGEKQRRVWTLTPNNDGSYTGTAGDVIGPAPIRIAGNSMFLNYTLRIPYGDGEIDLNIDDRMYQVAPGIIINESRMTKFGFDVGSILLVIEQRR
jgi:hypothetical protein